MRFIIKRLSIHSISRIPDDMQNKRQYKEFKYYTDEDMECVAYDTRLQVDRLIVVPKGFCTDGSSKSPDSGISWLFHDYLYATHRFNNETGDCTKIEADEIMKAILVFERMYLFKKVYTVVTKLDPLSLMTKAWRNSGERGMVIINNL